MFAGFTAIDAPIRESSTWKKNSLLLHLKQTVVAARSKINLKVDLDISGAR